MRLRCLPFALLLLASCKVPAEPTVFERYQGVWRAFGQNIPGTHPGLGQELVVIGPNPDRVARALMVSVVDPLSPEDVQCFIYYSSVGSVTVAEIPASSAGTPAPVVDITFQTDGPSLCPESRGVEACEAYVRSAQGVIGVSQDLYFYPIGRDRIAVGLSGPEVFERVRGGAGVGISGGCSQTAHGSAAP
jgi:hypothetical protein